MNTNIEEGIEAVLNNATGKKTKLAAAGAVPVITATDNCDKANKDLHDDDVGAEPTHKPRVPKLVLILAVAAVIGGIGGGAVIGNKINAQARQSSPAAKAKRLKGHEEIISGSEDTSNRHTYMASLQNGGSHFCGGTVLSSNLVLTAASCVEKFLTATSKSNKGNNSKADKSAHTIRSKSHKRTQSLSYSNNHSLSIPSTSAPTSKSGKANALFSKSHKRTQSLSYSHNHNHGLSIPPTSKSGKAKSRKGRSSNLDDITVVVGKDNIVDDNDGEEAGVYRAYLHPERDADNKDFDFAILVLKSSLSDAAYVTLNTDNDEPDNNDILRAIGWGTTVDGQDSFSDVLRLGSQFHAITKAECQDFFSPHSTVITESMICTSGGNICSGDFGGPLFVRGSSAADDVQFGVASFTKTDTCVGEAVFGRVSEGYDWIRRTVCKYGKDVPGRYAC